MNSFLTESGTLKPISNVVAQFESGPKQTHLTKAHLTPHPIQMGSVLLSSCEEHFFNGANIWSYPSGDHQKIVINKDTAGFDRSVVRDVLPINTGKGTPTLISCITPETVLLYKISS